MKKNQATARERQGMIAGWVGILSNLFLFFIKLGAAGLSHSVSIMADAMNSLFDGSSSLLTLLAFKWSAKPADKDHPYGHQRAEYIVGLVVAIFILFVGFQFLIESIKRIINPEPTPFNLWLVIIMVLSVGIKIIQALYYKKTARAMNSSTILAVSKDSMNDVFISLSILISLVVEHYSSWHLDGYVGLLVSGVIIASGIESIYHSAYDLLGAKPSPLAVKQMVDIIESYHQVLDYHDLDVHRYGPEKQYATVHIEVDARMTLVDAHYLVNQIEDEFAKKLQMTLVAHVDPIILNDAQQNQLHQQIKTLLHSYDPPYSFHDFRVIKMGQRIDKVLFDLVVPESVELGDDELYKIISQDIHAFAPDVDIAIDFDHHDIIHQAKADLKEDK